MNTKNKKFMSFLLWLFIIFVFFGIFYFSLYQVISSILPNKKFIIQVNKIYYVDDFVVSNGAISFESEGKEYTINYDEDLTIQPNSFYKGD